MTEKEITQEKKLLFDKLLDLLAVFDAVCKENQIQYFVCGGTMLGAIRHQGFIPWDDDIDVVVPRKDYDRLKAIGEKGAFKDPYFLQNPGSDEGFPKGYCRLRNSYTSEIPIFDAYEKCNHGIFIDIFPLDILPDNNRLLEKQIKKLSNIRLAMNTYSRYYSGIGTLGLSKINSLIYFFCIPLFKTHILTMKKLYLKYEKVAKKYMNTNYSTVGTIAGTFNNKRFIFPRVPWESQTKYVKFETLMVPIPQEYDAILRHSYGEYMVPVKEPTNHGETLFSATIPYNQFIEDNKEKLMNDRFKLTQNGKKERMK